MADCQRILFIGYTPPPVGGISIHVSRLISFLCASGFKVSLYDYLKELNWAELWSNIREHSIIHVHSANPYFRLLMALICKLARRHIIITIHGNLGRYGFLKNTADSLAVLFGNTIIVLNRDSYQKAVKINTNVNLLSAFLPPANTTLPATVTSLMDSWKIGFSKVFCTTAFDFKLDNRGNELYGISFLINIFKDLPKLGLIISDPTGNNQEKLNNTVKGIGNIFFLTETHNFAGVIKICDVMIRATTTDGDSISVREALYYGKPVIASDCVQRPAGCLIYKTNDIASFKEQIKSLKIPAIKPSLDQSYGKNYLDLFMGIKEELHS
jgi:glycosyltransferase involved in cell wall biosynthesis